MPRYFTHYWQNETWEHNKNITAENEFLDHCASNLFRKRGVSSGDFLYVVTIQKGYLYLCGKMQVAQVCSSDEAAEYLGREAEDLWEASEYVIAYVATPTNYNLIVPETITRNLKFLNAGNEKALFFDTLGLLDKQTLRGVRELSSKSALLLDKLLPELELLIEKDGNLSDLDFDVNQTEIEVFYEGEAKLTFANKYERNNRARWQCIKHYGWSCYVCGFSFADKYGELGKELIHVHHLVPISQIGERYKLDPIKDLRPICPNCHAIIQRKTPPYCIEEVKQLLRD